MRSEEMANSVTPEQSMISARGLVAAQYFSAGASCQCSARGSPSGERAKRFFGQSPIQVDQQHLMILIELVPGPRLSQLYNDARRADLR